MRIQRTTRAAVATAGLAVLAPLALAAPALGQDTGTAGFSPPAINVPSTFPPTPEGFIDADTAVADANREPLVRKAHERYGDLRAVPAEKRGRWEVGYVRESNRQDRVALVIVDGKTGTVLESWTGSQVTWPLARGREGQFGHVLNAPWVWIPLSAIFFLGLLDLRRMRRIVHLDLLVLLSFGISHIFFNEAEIGVSVPLAYPPLIYLLARMLWVGFRGVGERLRPSAPTMLLALTAIALICFRLAINIGDSGVIDVGFAGVIGADKIVSGQPIYGENSFPLDNRTGDTYGPANYYAYVPFQLAFGWSGVWDSLPAARAAAIFFDLATLAGLFVLGRRLGRGGDGPRSGGSEGGDPRSGGADGTRLGVVLAFGWAAFPYTAFALQSNSNDSLVAALIVWALVAFASPAGRAALIAVAASAKFAPLALVPLFAVGRRGLADRFEAARPEPGAAGRGSRLPILSAIGGLLTPWLRPSLRPVAYFGAVFVGTAALLLLHPAVDPGLATFLDRTVGKQLGRESPFSIWGQVSWLGPLQTAVGLAAAGLAVLLAFIPRRRSLAQIAALSAAVLIASQLAIEHWFYLYIPWFFGLFLIAIAAGSGSSEDESSMPNEIEMPPTR
jgi:hypothetical protein